MIFIVLYHSVCYYGIWSIPFAKQYESIDLWRGVSYIALNAFVFISGYLFSYIYIYTNKYQNYFIFIKNKFFRLLLPYLIWSVVVLALFPSKHPFRDIVSGHQHLWFLYMLFYIFIIAIIFMKKFLYQNLICQICELIFIVLCRSILGKFVSSNILHLFCFSDVLIYLPSFLLGGIMVSHKWEYYIGSWKPCYFWPIYFFSIILACVFLTSKSLPFGQFYINIPTYVFLVFSYAALSRLNLVIPSVVLSLDKCSMGIYIIHHVLIWLFIYYCPFSTVLLNEYYISSPIIIFVIAILISWGLTLLLMKNNYISKCIGC